MSACVKRPNRNPCRETFKRDGRPREAKEPLWWRGRPDERLREEAKPQSVWPDV